MESSFWQFISKLGWAVLFNIVFIVTSLPIISIGASYTALLTVMQNVVKDEKSGYIKLYFKAFVYNFIPSTIIWVISACVCIIWYLDLSYFGSLGTIYGNVAFGISLCLMILSLMYILTIFAVQAKFEGTLKETFQRAFMILTKDFIFVLIAAVFFVVIIVGITYSVIVRNVFSWMVIIMFGLNGLILSYIYNKIFKKYVEEDESNEEGLMDEWSE